MIYVHEISRYCTRPVTLTPKNYLNSFALKKKKKEKKGLNTFE